MHNGLKNAKGEVLTNAKCGLGYTHARLETLFHLKSGVNTLKMEEIKKM